MDASIVPLTFAQSSSTKFNTYGDCYNQVLSKKLDNANLQKVKDFVDKGGMEFLQALEDQYNCASICNVPLFYITKDIAEGKPTSECGDALI